MNRKDRDEGAVLPLVLVMTVVISAVVIGLSNWAVTSLAFGQVAEDRSDRLSAADAGMRYAIDQLKLRNAGCILDTQEAVLPGVQADFNDATAAVTCERITSGFEGIAAYAAVMTGAGIPPGQALLTSQSGSNEKVLGGPVYMSRVGTGAFDLDPPVKVKDGPLLYHDTSGTTPCTSVKASTMPTNLVFEPELIFGPVCVSVPWTEIFKSPEVPDLTVLPEMDGSLPSSDASPLPDPSGLGSYVDDANGCRVFAPGRYTTPPDIDGDDAYFQSGDYLFDFAGSNDTFFIKAGTVTAGRVNPFTTPTLVNEISNPKCAPAQGADPAQSSPDPADQYGATFYFAGSSRINVATQGSLEIHARQQGVADYVSVQTLCEPNGIWCNPSGGGGPFPTSKASTISGVGDNFLFTDSGNNKEFVAHALVYVPRAQVEFGNVSNTATQKMLGGLIVSRLVLQSSTSATNFEIQVPTSPITARIQLTSTAVKNGTTSIQAVVEYRPYEANIDERIRVNSWRVCETDGCS
jgi:hypothetical protein